MWVFLQYFFKEDRRIFTEFLQKKKKPRGQPLASGVFKGAREAVRPRRYYLGSGKNGKKKKKREKES